MIIKNPHQSRSCLSKVSSGQTDTDERGGWPRFHPSGKRTCKSVENPLASRRYHPAAVASGMHRHSHPAPLGFHPAGPPVVPARCAARAHDDHAARNEGPSINVGRAVPGLWGLPQGYRQNQVHQPPGRQPRMRSAWRSFSTFAWRTAAAISLKLRPSEAPVEGAEKPRHEIFAGSANR